MDWTVIAALATGWLGQLLKAQSRVPTWVAQVIVFAAAFGFYGLGEHPTVTARQYIFNGVVWSLAVLGVSSVAAGTGIAPKTDSK